MRKTLLTIAAFSLSAVAHADISSGNSDLDGWAVEDQSLRSVQMRSTADVKSPFGSPDQYGGVLFDQAPSTMDTPAAPGIGDSYGSILHEVGFSY